MKWSIVLILGVVTLSQAQEKSFKINPPRGMATNYDGSNLREDLVTNAQNVFFDKDLGVVRSNGYTRDNLTSIGSQPVYGLYQFVTSTGSQYLISLSSNVLSYSLGDGVYTTIISTLRPAFTYDCTSALNRFWCTSTTGAFYLTAGLSVVDSTPTFPLGSMIENHANRIWVAGVVGNRNVLYGSKFLDGDNWTLGGNANDSVTYTFGINSGDFIRGIKSAFDKLYVGERRSMWKLVGKSQNDFTQVNISPVIGLLQHKSMRDKQGNLYWLSNRGIERMEGQGDNISFPPFYDSIKDITDKIIVGYDNDATTSRNVTDTSQGDFSPGNSSYTSIYQVVDSVQISSPSRGRPFGTNVMLNNSGTSCGYVWAQSFTSDLAANLVGFKVRQVVGQTGSSNPLIVNISSADVSFSTKPVLYNFLSTSVITSFSGDYFSTSSIPLIQSSTYWIVFRETQTLSQLPYVFQISSVGGNSDEMRYTRGGDCSENMTTGAPLRYTVNISSGQFVSTVKDLGASVKSMSTFNSNVVNNEGNIIFYVRSGNTSNAAQTATWISQVNGSTFAAPTNEFVQWRADYSISFTTQTPLVQDVTINWVDNANKPNVASWVFDDQYWLACSTNSSASAYNETVIVADRFDNFTKFNGLNAASFAEAFGKRYFGVSTSTGADTGLIFYLGSSILNYDGRPIDSFIETKDYCGGDGCSSVEEWDKVYIKTRNPNIGGGVLSSQYQLNSDGNYTNLGDVSLTETGGLINSKVLFPFGTGGTLGNSIKMKYYNNQLNQPFKFLGAEIFYNTRIVD